MADKKVSSLRDRVLQKEDIQSEVVEVPQWGEKFEVRSLSGVARARFMQAFVKEDGSMDFETMYPALLIATCFDPDTGERVFEDGDVAALNLKSGAALEVLAQAAMRLSGMTQKAVEEAGKGSGSTLSGGSISS